MAQQAQKKHRKHESARESDLSRNGKTKWNKPDKINTQNNQKARE